MSCPSNDTPSDPFYANEFKLLKLLNVVQDNIVSRMMANILDPIIERVLYISIQVLISPKI